MKGLTARITQKFLLLGCFNTFSDNLKTKSMGHVNYG
ncbi:protein of unknown function [Magnetospirillum gryphiswaldense MSR-1 v2]|uniref:Uncharacterized protein n=1 Tax=Magnetospirillum gryphiswaldense (strain DSM 6361 / JCM 21280 / NBRC 15271 / MSR-1) TaxID=431944 RepID=V6F381_MAGGM|nr:protein of unknown function [Magnetospirillum gryphiswaldense MSR-1 v2]